MDPTAERVVFSNLWSLERQRAAERICGCTFDSLAGRREAAVFSLICKLLDKECVEPLQAFCPDFAVKVVSEGGAKTRQRTAAESDDSFTFGLHELGNWTIEAWL